MQKSEKILKLYNWLQNAIAANKNQSLIKIRPVVPEKNAKKWENFETLQLAAECHSINKNQRFIKIKPVVPEKNGKSEVPKFWNFTIGCRMPQHKQKSKFDQDQTSSSWEKCKKVKKFWNFTIGCRAIAQHKQKSKFDQDETSSSWEKCSSLEKWTKKWFWNFTIGCRVPQQGDINVWWRPLVVLQKNAKMWENFEIYNWLQSGTA